jgi:hypothetical protein
MSNEDQFTTWQYALEEKDMEIANLQDEMAQLRVRIVSDTALSVLREHLKIAAVMGNPVTLSSNAAASIFYSMPTSPADTARLDWMMSKVCCDDIGFYLPFSTSKINHFQAFRAAIDEAIVSSKGTK